MAEVGRLEKRAMRAKRHTQEGIRQAEEMLEHVDTEGNLDYLELGCGVGHVAKHCASKYGWNVTGTDYDPEMIAFATEGFDETESIRFQQADATDLPFEDGSFDIALSFGILHHINNWEDAIREVSRVLRDGGHYLLGEIVYSRFSKRLLGWFVKNYGVYTLGDLERCIEGSGMRAVYRFPPKGSFLKYHALVIQKQPSRAGTEDRPSSGP